MDATSTPEQPETEPDGVDTAFAADLDPETAHYGELAPLAPHCPWCDAPLPAPEPERCPACQVAVRASDAHGELPGLTVLSQGAQAALHKFERRHPGFAVPPAATLVPRDPGPLDLSPEVDEVVDPAAPAVPAVDGAYEPPSDDVRSMMRRIEQEAALATAPAPAELEIERLVDRLESEPPFEEPTPASS